MIATVRRKMLLLTHPAKIPQRTPYKGFRNSYSCFRVTFPVSRRFHTWSVLRASR
jgi:hypothetical protein